VLLLLVVTDAPRDLSKSFFSTVVLLLLVVTDAAREFSKKN
jgi:hypothetical protein